jgi:hypothetical protein
MKADFVVPKLEGLWWFDHKKYALIGLADAPKQIPRDEWHYRLLIRLPDFVDEKMIGRTREEIADKKNLPAASTVHYMVVPEHSAGQILHVGPFYTEPDSLELLQEFMEDNGLTQNGLHHEIYLSDFRRAAPEKLRTILREPVK